MGKLLIRRENARLSPWRRALSAIRALAVAAAAALVLFAPVAPDDPMPVPEEAVQATLLSGPDFTGCTDGAPFIRYGEPDALGRPAAAFALLSRENLTAAERPDMSDLTLPGLHNARYDFIRDGWVYNRCHLIGHRFGGASVPENLITGTHALNITGMLPWEDAVAACLRRTGRHVFYRVTPMYEGDDLVCSAVLVEAMSCDGGASLCFAALCPNVQPGVAIDYATGYTTLADDWQSGGTAAGPRDYVLNARTGKFHLPGCEEAKSLSRRNRKDCFCQRGELLRAGRIPCGRCRP